MSFVKRLTAHPAWRFFAVLPSADRALAGAWWTVLALRGVLPPLFAVAMGRLVGAVQFELRAAESVGVGDLPRSEDRPAVTAAVARAGAQDVIDKLPSGLDTQLGATWPGGSDLSFGQWQKLALARGFMRERPLVLVLDEPTAALDAETEHALFERYAEQSRTGDRITILVSHRFSTVRMADLIVVLDGAKVVEVGSHEELIARGGWYAQLYGIQAAAYR